MKRKCQDCGLWYRLSYRDAHWKYRCDECQKESETYYEIENTTKVRAWFGDKVVDDNNKKRRKY